MNKNLRTRAIVIAVVTLLSLIAMFGPWNKPKGYARTAGDFFKPSKLKQNLSENIRLGLDLRGGTHLVMQVQAEDAIMAITQGNQLKAEDELKKASIQFDAVKAATPGLLVVETPDTSKHTEIKDKLLPFFGTDIWEVTTSTNPATVTFTLTNAAANQFRREATEQAKTIIEQRINQFGVAEPTVQLHGREEDHQILVQMPGVDNPERVKELIKGEARLEIRAVDTANPQRFNTREEAMAALGGDTSKEVLPYNEKRGDGGADTGFYIVERTPVITGSDLRDARGVQSQQGFGFEVAFSLKPIGAEKFGKWTGDNVGNYLAVVLSNEIKSVAVVKSRIDDSGRIEGNFTQQQAEDLGLVLRSGALPAKVRYLEERTVGPSLGADSIRQGLFASIVGLGFVVLCMLFYYRFSGVNAVVALVLNLIILLAGLAVFSATLTLPGIAGVILLIGMAVDSNVLIFERIREELHAGKIVTSAVDTGFNKALVTIIDTHVTTIVSAAFLYAFGTGPIKGFAVTLTIGLLANLFTAIYVSRSMFMWVLNRGGRRAETISI
jgi:preprotein translocase subunit SecD